MKKLIIFSIIFYSLFIIHNSVSADITTGMIGYWKFDETSGTTALDSSGSGNNGTLVNGPVWTTAGKINGALSFDGVDDYVAKNPTSFDFTNNPTKSHSISAWFYPKYPGAPNYGGLGISNTGMGMRIMCVDEAVDRWSYQIKGGSTYPRSNNGPCVQNTWQHVVGVYNAANTTIYIYYNGVEVASSIAADIDTSTDNNYLRIGYNQWYFNGLIDEVRIYNKALSASEVTELYNYTGTGGDTQAPTFPTNLSATAVSSSQINLTWTVSTDNVGVTGYRIYRCQGSGCTPSNQITTVTTNSYQNTGLSASAAYVYKVAAYDATGNVSSQSSSASATTQASGPQTYYVSTTGSDNNPGTQTQPWKTIQKAVNTVVAGDTIYVRGGEYNGASYGWSFRNSGTKSKPITFSNYPGEQIVLKFIAANGRPIFVCQSYVKDHPDWQTPKADYIRIIGTDVAPRILSNGVESKKGIVMLGMEAQQPAGIAVSDCDYWEVAGVDFVEVGYGMFTTKINWSTMEEHSTDHWYVHDNRVYTFYRESGMQFNGDENRIENNEVYKVTNRVDTPFGCQHFNFLGDHNIIKGNTLSRLGSTAACNGIIFEWDLSDMNTVEQNRISDVTRGIDIEGGDNNVIRNNIIYATGTPDPWAGGIEIKSYDNSIKTDWPCNEALGGAESAVILPANNPAHPDYQYYYNPRNCHSYGNQIYNNTIHGFVEGIRLYELAGENTIIRNNVFSGWTRGGVCFYQASNGTCKPLPADVIADYNAGQGNFAFQNITNYNFHLLSGSSLINVGYNLGSLVPNDFDGITRPQGAGWDIGAYEYSGAAPPDTTPPAAPTGLTVQ